MKPLRAGSVDSPPENAVRIAPVNDPDNEMKQRVVEALRAVRREARSEPTARLQPPPGPATAGSAKPLGSMPESRAPSSGTSPDRRVLNEKWNVSATLEIPPQGRLGRFLAPLRRPLQKLIRFSLGPLVEHQTEWNSAQVKFDNELVTYVDERMDRMTAHYDRVLGLHGKRMEEMDERHLILQQELIQHVHDLVKRIDFVFETAEQNHLYLEGMLREVREELQAIAERLSSAAADNPPQREEKAQG